MTDAARPIGERQPWLFPTLLVGLLLVAYGLGIDAGWLAYDDDWLVAESPVMRDASPRALVAILFDFSRETRLILGAEYLPVRDVITWTLVRLVGTSPEALHLAQLAIYAAAVLAWRGVIRRMLGATLAADVATLAFALHPVHVESVAWLAGIKDVLALLFSGLALSTYVAAPLDRDRRGRVLVFILLACFAKAVSVVLPLLFLVADAWIRRRPDRTTIAASSAVAALAALIHARVGADVGMYAAMPGGSRIGALATMTPVALRYLGRVLLIEPASIVYDVPDRTLADPTVWLSLALLALIGVAATVARRAGDGRPLLLLALVAVTLAPVSQLVAPIQNRMADRYLLVALVAPCIALGASIGLVRDRVSALALAAVTTIVLGGATLQRVQTFASPVALWREASERAPRSPIGPYQLAMRPELPTDAREAAFREALRRDGMRTDAGRRAADNLAILLTRDGQIEAAMALLEDAWAHFPDDPHVGHNLAVLLDMRGQHERARRTMLHVIEVAPGYENARRWYRARWGEPPIAAPTGGYRRAL